MPDVSIDAELKSFNTMVAKMTQLSSKTVPEVLNRQAKNFCYRAAQFSDKGERSKILKYLNDEKAMHRFITKLTLDKHGKGYTMEQHEALRPFAEKIIKGRLRTIGYMKSAWAKAGHMIRAKTNAGPSVKPPAASLLRLKSSKAKVIKAVPGKKPAVDITAIWGADNTKPGKERLSSFAARRAFRFLVRDMRKFMRSRLEKDMIKSIKKGNAKVVR